MSTLTATNKVGKTLVLCFDGTTDLYGVHNTNIIRFFDLLQKDDPDRQMVYYQPGIGTYANPGMWMPLAIKLSKVVDQAFAWFLDNHIQGGYKFLMQNYRKGDRICLFGFSRGAYTARCLAGMLHKVGLLPISNQEQVPFAYSMYKDNSEKGWAQSSGFKRTFSRTVSIEFVGCWDTVSSVGVLIPRHLPFSSANTIIRTFRHALALDERRVRYEPNLWHREVSHENFAEHDPEHSSVKKHSVKDSETAVYVGKTDVEEVWFAGCHGDVGGGSTDNTEPHALSFVSLRWMIEQTTRTQSGILYNPGALKSIGFSTSPFVDAQLGRLNKWLEHARVDVAKNGEVKEVDVGGEPSRMEKVVQEEKAKCDTQKQEKDDMQQVEAGGRQRPAPIPAESSSSSCQPRTPRHHPGRLSETTEYTYVEPQADQHSTAEDRGTRRRSLFHWARNVEPPPFTATKLDATNQVVVPGETEKDRQERDVMSPIHDELKKKPQWWLLEIFPMVVSYQDEDGRWHRDWRVNLGRPRRILATSEPTLHVSVKKRMEAGIGYQPKAKFLKGIQRARWSE